MIVVCEIGSYVEVVDISVGMFWMMIWDVELFDCFVVFGGVDFGFVRIFVFRKDYSMNGV